MNTSSSDAGTTRVLVLPLYPQYSGTTTASIGDAVFRWSKTIRNLPAFRFVQRYHDDPGYIGALAKRANDHWMAHGRPDKLVVSFHGLLGAQLPAAPGMIKGQVAAWCGGQDPFVPLEHVEAFRAEMTAAQASSQIIVFSQAAHGFTDPDAGAMGRPGGPRGAFRDPGRDGGGDARRPGVSGGA